MRAGARSCPTCSRTSAATARSRRLRRKETNMTDITSNVVYDMYDKRARELQNAIVYAQREIDGHLAAIANLEALKLSAGIERNSLIRNLSTGVAAVAAALATKENAQ